MEGRHYRTATREALSERQREVLGLLARGQTNAQIAEALGMTLDGAKWHVSEIITKLGVSTREEAVAAWQSERRLPQRIRRGLSGLVVGLRSPWVAAPVAFLVVAGTGWLLLNALRGSGADVPGGDGEPGDAAVAALTPAGELAECPVDPYRREPRPPLGSERGACVPVVESDLTSLGGDLTCYEDLAAIGTKTGFRVIEPPDDLDAEPVQAAVLATGDGPAAYTAYRVGDRVLEMLQGPVKLPGVSHENLLLVQGGASDGIRVWGEHGIILDWCPTLGLFHGDSYDCGGGIHLLMTGLPMTDIAKMAFDISRPTIPGGNPTPIPYPAPRGEHVDARVADVPVYPGAVEVDGFETPAIDTTWAVQVYETEDYPEQELKFFEDRLEADDWRVMSQGGQASGYTVTYQNISPLRGTISIYTGYADRPGEQSDPAPGFRGGGAPFDNRLGCLTRFSVWTR